jgi:hypothetical protein
MKILLWNTQLFPIDTALVTYHPEDESSPERGKAIMNTIGTLPMNSFDAIALLGVWDGYSSNGLLLPKTGVYQLNPTMGSVVTMKPLTVKPPPNPNDPISPTEPSKPKAGKTVEEIERDIKKIQEANGVNSPAGSIAVTKAGNGIYIETRVPILGKLVEPYQDSAGNDTGAAKGLAAVDLGNEKIMVTHLQDSTFEDETAYAYIRRKQLEQLVQQYTSYAAGDLLFGEFNIRGDNKKSPGNTEWEKLFDRTDPSSPVKSFSDAWSKYMTPPGVAANAIDQGYNAIRRKENIESRLVYTLVSDHTTNVPYHISMPLFLRHNSERYGVSVEYGKKRPHCSPSDAIVVDFRGSQYAIYDVSFDGEHGPRWLYVKDAGTYSILSKDPKFNVEIYSLKDFSTPLGVEDESDIRGTIWENVALDLLQGSPKGVVYAPSDPFLIKLSLRKRNQSYIGDQRLMILKHDGGTQGTAYFINVNKFDPTPILLPLNQPLPPTDICWLRLRTPHVLSQIEVDNRIIFDNPSGKQVEYSIQDSNQVPLKMAGTQVTLNAKLPTREKVFVTINRLGDRSITTFAVRWKCNVTFLRLDKPFILIIDDETGADWVGDDEVTFVLQGEREDAVGFFYSIDFPDADTGDSFSVVKASLLDHMKAKTDIETSIAFVNQFKVGAREDDFDDDKFYYYSIEPLPYDDASFADQTTYVKTQEIKMPIQTGQYRLTYTLSRTEQL